MGIERTAKTIIVLALGIAILMASCTKPSIIGTGIFPDEDFTNLEFTDTISMVTTSVEGDTLRVYSVEQIEQLNYYLCGIVNDPVFGESFSQVFNQFILTRTNPDFSEVFSVDSLVLRIGLDRDSLKYVGDLSQPQAYNVYRLNEPMSALDEYYSNQTFQAGNLIGSIDNYYPNIVDSIPIIRGGDTTTLPPHISIHLDQTLAMDMVMSDDSTFSGNSNFRNYFNGINIVPDAGNTAMMRFNYSAAISNMTLYYTEGTHPDSLLYQSFTFAINTLTAKTVNFAHNYSGTPVQDAIDGTATHPDSLIYIQGMEGPNAKISFPYAHLIDDIIVNNAELILTVAEPAIDTVQYPLPDYLVATELVDGIGEIALLDVSAGGIILNSYGGNYSVVEENGVEYRRYRLNISKHFQGIVDGTVENPDIYLSVFDKAESANRVILGGGQNTDFQAKLNLTYTKLE